MTNWDDYCSRFLNTYLKPGHKEAMNTLTPLLQQAVAEWSQQDETWLADALQDEHRKWFAVEVISLIQAPIPEVLFHALIRAAIYEVNPSLNREFIRPCEKSDGLSRVGRALLDYFQRGTNYEKSGAANALYWATPDISYNREKKRHKSMTTIPASDDEIAFWLEQKQLFLQEFVVNTDLDVQRSLIPKLELQNKEVYPEALQPLVDEAIRIARSHPDDYIRNRVEVQLGNSVLLPALPHRKKHE